MSDYDHVAYHDVWILRDKDFPKNSSFSGPSKQFHPSWRVVRNGSIFAKNTHFWVPQNSSIPREVSLETVHFLSILPKNEPFWGPSKRFHPSWSVVRNSPKKGLQQTHGRTDGQTDRRTNIKFRDVSLLSRTCSTIAPFGGNNVNNNNFNTILAFAAEGGRMFWQKSSTIIIFKHFWRYFKHF